MTVGPAGEADLSGMETGKQLLGFHHEDQGPRALHALLADVVGVLGRPSAAAVVRPELLARLPHALRASLADLSGGSACLLPAQGPHVLRALVGDPALGSGCGSPKHRAALGPQGTLAGTSRGIPQERLGDLVLVSWWPGFRAEMCPLAVVRPMAGRGGTQGPGDPSRPRPCWAWG